MTPKMHRSLQDVLQVHMLQTDPTIAYHTNVQSEGNMIGEKENKSCVVMRN